MNRKIRSHRLATLGGALALLALAPTAQGQQISNQVYQTNVNIDLLPFAVLEIVGSNRLYLEVPPSGSTIPSSGVEFMVVGNATATLTAEPDAFMEIPGEGFIGRASQGSDHVGYKIELRFPKQGALGSPPQYGALPGYAPGPTEPPLTVDLTATGMQRAGVIHMEAHPQWTDHGGIPLPGTYTGNVTLTLIAN